MNLDSKTVLITGGASGIGLALAQRFLQAGSREDVHNAIRNHGSRHDLSNCVVQVLPGPLLLRR